MTSQSHASTSERVRELEGQVERLTSELAEWEAEDDLYCEDWRIHMYDVLRQAIDDHERGLLDDDELYALARGERAGAYVGEG